MKRLTKAIVIFLTLVLMGSLCACGVGKKEFTVEGTYNLFAAGTEGYLTEPVVVGFDSSELTLNEDGTGSITLNGTSGDIPSWTATEDGYITIETQSSQEYSGTVNNGVMLLDIDGVVLYYAQDGADTSSYTIMSEDEFIAAGGQAAIMVKNGKEYLYGINGVAYDRDLAEECFKGASEQGNGEAWYYLGKCYEESDRDGKFEKEEECMNNAVENGSELGLYGLGRMYEYGLGDFDIDYEKAKDYYQQAIDAGLPEGYSGLARLYQWGDGVEADGAQALEYFQEAMEGNDFGIVNSARVESARIYFEGMGGVEQDNMKGMALLEEAMEAGYSGAYNYMGNLYYYGDGGLEQDYAQANDCYRVAAALGSSGAMRNLGNAYRDGTGVDVDIPTSLEWYEKAVALGSGDAYNSLGVYYSNEAYNKGNSDLDYAKAMEYFIKADAAGNSKGAENIGVMYYSGYGVDKNYAAALPWFLKAADSDQGIAAYLAAGIYQDGTDGVEANPAEALRLYKIAVDSGDLSDSQLETANSEIAALGG